MIRRRARMAGIATPIRKHTMRGTRITTHLKHRGAPGKGQQKGKHSSSPPPQRYPPHGGGVRPREDRKKRNYNVKSCRGGSQNPLLHDYPFVFLDFRVLSLAIVRLMNRSFFLIWFSMVFDPS